MEPYRTCACAVGEARKMAAAKAKIAMLRMIRPPEI
jgi:hypothetical protein